MTQSPPAVILAAGRGERLSGGASSPPKPLAPLLGLALLERVILSCKAAGVGEFYVVLGYRREEIQPHLATWGQKYRILIRAVDNPIWPEGNGTSVLACAPRLASSFLVLMSDHLVDPAAISHLIEQGKNEETCCLLVDYRIDRIFDPQDATRVHVDEGKITAIGKGLEPYNGIDTGNFFCRPFLFDALKEVRAEGDGSLTGAIRRVIDQGKMRAVDYGDRFWLDVDTPKALKHARKALLRQTVKTDEDGFIAWLTPPMRVSTAWTSPSAPRSPAKR